MIKALILEDNKSLAESLKKTLEGQGWLVETSPSWEKVSYQFETDKFQLILLDILLAGKKGVEVLKILSEKQISSKIIVITGFFNEEVVFKELPLTFLKNCRFLKKPLQDKKLLEVINSLIDNKSSSTVKKWGWFFEKGVFEQPLSFYFPESSSFESQQLIPLLFSAHLKDFTGDIVLGIDSKKNSIHFYKGSIVQILSSSHKSFFGEILIEHGFSLTDDVKQVLDDKTSKKRIGEKLIEKKLLSAPMLELVLKEQMKIRLSEFMSHPSFPLQLIEKKPEDFKKIEIEFNKIDFMDWLADSIQTELKSDFWESFYFDIKACKVSPLSLLNVFSVSQKSFFNNYNKFFRSLTASKKASELTKTNKEDHLKFLFFGLIAKSLFLKESSGGKQAFEEFKNKSRRILSGSEEEILKLLGWPHSSLQLSGLKKNYKDLTSQIHPDFLPADISPSMKKEAEQALEKLTEVYQKLLQKFEGEATPDRSAMDLVHVMNIYKEGIDLIQKEAYKEAFEALSKIIDHSQAPSNTYLYMLWADLKKKDWDLVDKHRNKGLDIQKRINSCPIHLRTSYLFWFVKGLFYYRCGKHEKAQELFKKALFIESSFSQAKLELLLIRKKIKEQNKNKNSLLSFFKKSG